MIIHYDVPRLEELIRNLFDLTGISLSVLDTDYHTLTHCSHPGDFCSMLQKTGTAGESCRKCDSRILKKCSRSGVLEGHICAAGLYDCAMPIKKYDTIVGYVLMGRVRSVNSPEKLQPISGTQMQMMKRLQQLYDQIPTMTQKQLGALYELLPSILFDHAIQIIFDPLINEIVEYIQQNLRENLSVESLCERFHISSNHLYNAFHDNLNRTVYRYITEQRMEKARELLLTTNEPVYAVAERAGIGNYPYFCKLFKKETGCTPGQYRKTQRK